jgi:excisionase family DNA binding protein
MPETVTPQVLSLKDAATYSGVSHGTIRRQVDTGELPSVLVGPRRRVILISDMDAFLQSRRRTAETVAALEAKSAA